MLDKILALAILSLLFITIFAFALIPAWVNHTRDIQLRVHEDLSELKDSAIDWKTWDYTRSSEVLRTELSREVTNLNLFMFRIPLEEALVEYREVINDIIAIVVNDADNYEELQYLVGIAQAIQSNFYSSGEKFTNNLFYAMTFTF